LPLWFSRTLTAAPGQKLDRPRIPGDRLTMTEAALRTMKQIVSTYVEDGYPNYHVWWFRLRDDDSASSELMALGLIESIGVWRSYKLTREGKYWALNHRSHAGTSLNADAY
jgi:hypothetical protein